jgi:hypothetical protein
MKSQSKPFVVEVKQSRAQRDKSRSIWGKIDIAEVTRRVAEDLVDNQAYGMSAQVDGQKD